ncbi:MAG: DUF4258 domain-containing protein [archaeon]
MEDIISLIGKYKGHIEFTKHALMRLDTRKISPAEVIENVKNPGKSLIDYKSQSDNRYVLIFGQNGRKLLMVVVLIENETIFVITAISTTKKLSKLVKKWQK